MTEQQAPVYNPTRMDFVEKDVMLCGSDQEIKESNRERTMSRLTWQSTCLADDNFLTTYSDVKPIDNRCFTVYRDDTAVVSSGPLSVAAKSAEA